MPTVYPNNKASFSGSSSASVSPISARELLLRERRSLLTRPRLTLFQPAATSSGTVSSEQTSSDIFELKLGITEIAGVAGSGKTQIGLGLCVSCAASVVRNVPQNVPPNVPPNVPQEMRSDSMRKPPCAVRNPYAKRANMAIVTAPAPPSPSYWRSLYVTMCDGGENAVLNRLNRMATARHGPRRSKEILSRILVKSIYNEEQLKELIYDGLPPMLRRSSDDSQEPPSKIGVIVLDSIGGLFRTPSEEGLPKCHYERRSGLLFGIAARLKEMSCQYDLPVVVVNQVTSSFTNRVVAPSSEINVIPALGLSWSNCVNTRFLLTRRETNTDHNDNKSSTKFTRNAFLLLSSSLYQSKPKAFLIDATGSRAVC